MDLEASDINDGTILNATKQSTDARGNVQFRVTLPSGREIHSEWIKSDQRKQAMMAWLEKVKEQITSDVQDLQRAKREKARAAQAANVTPVTNYIVQANNASAAEPLAYAKGQYEFYASRVQTLTDNLGQTRLELDTAVSMKEQWQTIINALSGQESSNVS